MSADGLVDSSVLISVVIPCYNYGAYVPETLDSLLAQTYSNWEAIVVDDGSVDDTAAVVRTYCARDARIQYHYQQNQGLSAARNTGIALAKGEYLQLLDADDFIAPTKLAIHASVLAADSETALVFSDAYTFLHSSVPAADRAFSKFLLTMPPMSGQGQELILHITYDNIFLPGCPLFRRALAKAVGDFDVTLFSLEDWHFWYRAALQGAKFVYDGQLGTEFYARSHGNNMSGNRSKMWANRIKARQSLLRIMVDVGRHDAVQAAQLRPVIRKMQGYLYEELARFNLFFGRIPAGLGYALRYVGHGGKPWTIGYDSAYWLKERLLGRNQR